METEQQTGKHTFYRTRWFKITTGVVIAFLLILILLPRGISWGIRKALMENGAENVTIENVDFNPFTGALRIDNLAILKADQPLLNLQRLEARVDWIPFISKRILVTELRMDELKLISRSLQDGQLRIAGFLLPITSSAQPTDKNAKPWGFGLDTLQLTNLHFTHHFPGQKYQLDVKGIDLLHLKSWEPGTPGAFRINAQLNGAPVQIDVNVQPFTDEVSVDGKIQVKNLRLHDFAHFVSQQASQLAGTLSLNQSFKVRFRQGQYTRLTQQGSLGLRNFSFANQNTDLQQEVLNWNGAFKLEQNLKTHASTLSLNGKLEQQGLALQLPAQNLKLQQGSLVWQGSLRSEQDVNNTLKLDGSLSLGTIAVQRNAVELARIAQLDVNKLAIQGLGQISAENIILQNLSALEEIREQASDKQQKNLPLTRMDKLVLDTVQIKDKNQVAIHTITLHNSNTTVTRLQNKKLAVLELLQSPAKQKTDAKPATEPPAATENSKSSLRIDQINFTGKNLLAFNDYSVKPVFRRTIDFNKLSLSDIDNSKPEQASPIMIAGKIGKYATIDLKGHVKPFTPKPGLKLAGTLNNIDLPPLSSYTSRTLGYDLSSGTLNAEVDVTIDNGKIIGKNKLRLNQLQVKPTDPDKIKSLTAQLTMPLDAALSMLRDKNNIIELKLPISGDITDPQFNLSDVINTALGNVMKTAAMSYLSQALQPYGSLITLVKLAKKASNAINLQPIQYDANTHALTDTSKDYLGKIAGLMNERPKLSIRICGIAARQDRDAITAVELEKLRKKTEKEGGDLKKIKPPVIADDTLLTLARTRADNIKDWLVSQHKIAPDRLFTCNPEIDQDEKGTPRVELGI